MAKHNQRLDYARLAEVLHERGMAEVDVLREFLQQSQTGGAPFAEALVQSNLVSDWDLSRLVCEIFNLPFLTVDMLEINSEIAHGLNHDTLIENGLVPIGRFGQVLTICMPGLVPADVLAMLAVESNHVVLPVVGTVETNRRWIAENLTKGKSKAVSSTVEAVAEPIAAAVDLVDDTELADLGVLEGLEELEDADMEIEVAEVSADTDTDTGADAQVAARGSGWGEMFDDADDAVMTELVAENPELQEANALEFHVSQIDDMDIDVLPSLTELGSDLDLDTSDAGSPDLPPMPKFGESS